MLTGPPKHPGSPNPMLSIKMKTTLGAPAPFGGFNSKRAGALALRASISVMGGCCGSGSGSIVRSGALSRVLPIDQSPSGAAFMPGADLNPATSFEPSARAIPLLSKHAVNRGFGPLRACQSSSIKAARLYALRAAPDIKMCERKEVQADRAAVQLIATASGCGFRCPEW